MKLVLIVSEIILLSSCLVFYPTWKTQDTAKSNSGVILAEAVPPDRGSPSTRGKGRRGRFHEDRTTEIEFG